MWANLSHAVAAYALLDQDDRAFKAGQLLAKIEPDFSIDFLRKAPTSDHPDYLKHEKEHYFRGLRKAGVLERLVIRSPGA